MCAPPPSNSNDQVEMVAKRKKIEKSKSVDFHNLKDEAVESSDEEVVSSKFDIKKKPSKKRDFLMKNAGVSSDSESDSDGAPNSNEEMEMQQNMDQETESDEEFYEPPVNQTGPSVAEIMSQYRRNDDSETKTIPSKEKPKKATKKHINTESLAKFQDKLDKTGVVYLARVPPFMKPQKIRHLLSKYGAIGRIFLQPEDKKVASKRKRAGGSRKDNFTEGWIEFEDKKVAKLVATELNNQIIGGKKRNWYHDDLWTLKYLSGFKWHHLKEQVAYEKAVKDQKLKTEMMQQKRENKLFMQNVEKAKMIEAMEAKRAIKQQSQLNTEVKSDNGLKEMASKVRRSFKQRKVIDVESEAVKNETALNQLQLKKQKEVLAKIFS